MEVIPNAPGSHNYSGEMIRTTCASKRLGPLLNVNTKNLPFNQFEEAFTLERMLLLYDFNYSVD